MKFWRIFKSSVYDPSFYRAIGERKTSGAFGYFALLVLVASLIASANPIADVAGFVFQSSGEKDALREEVLSIYPDELEITFKNGEISTNVSEPYSIPFPESLKDKGGEDAEYPENLLVIDTGKSISADDFEALDTFVILGRDSVGVYQPGRKKVQIQNLENASAEYFVLDKGRFTSLLGTAEGFARWFGFALLFLIPFLVFSVWLSGYLLYLLFGALVIWIVAKIRGTPWGYGTSYKAGLHLLTLPILYGVVSSPPFIPELHIHFFFTGLLALAAVINLAPAPIKEQEIRGEIGNTGKEPV